MIDPLLSLAFAMHSQRGVYALLLGSGISRGAQVPTGWEVVSDLARKLAVLKGENWGADPAEWYRNSFGEEPNYSKLLGTVAKFPAERSQLLRGYFEPTDEEREQGVKVPTAAHRAIAAMIRSGHVRVVLTTNFDRLLEDALSAIGIVPTVLATPDSIEGTVPLTHAERLIVKLHGDYLDTRIKNTTEELESYDPRMNQFLDRVLDEFGLVVCGWSAEWDTALRAAIERCKGRRFTTFWAAKGDPTAAAQQLITQRGAQVIAIDDADSFFRGLADKVTALDELDRPHPLSTKSAVATLKRFLTGSQYQIQLHDLLMEETDRLCRTLADTFSPQDAYSDEELIRRVERYEALSISLVSLFATGCYWGGSAHRKLWVKCLERVANAVDFAAGLEVWVHLRRYPALLLSYVGGIAAIAADDYEALRSLLLDVEVRELAEHSPAAVELVTHGVMSHDFQQRLPGMQGHHTPLSERLQEQLRSPLREILPDDVQYVRCFDRYEYLLALVHLDDRQVRMPDFDVWAPLGCFSWRYFRRPGESVQSKIEAEYQLLRAEWPPLKAGLLGGETGRFESRKKALDEFIARPR